MTSIWRNFSHLKIKYLSFHINIHSFLLKFLHFLFLYTFFTRPRQDKDWLKGKNCERVTREIEVNDFSTPNLLLLVFLRLESNDDLTALWLSAKRRSQVRFSAQSAFASAFSRCEYFVPGACRLPPGCHCHLHSADRPEFRRPRMSVLPEPGLCALKHNWKTWHKEC